MRLHFLFFKNMLDGVFFRANILLALRQVRWNKNDSSVDIQQQTDRRCGDQAKYKSKPAGTCRAIYNTFRNDAFRFFLSLFRGLFPVLEQPDSSRADNEQAGGSTDIVHDGKAENSIHDHAGQEGGFQGPL